MSKNSEDEDYSQDQIDAELDAFIMPDTWDETLEVLRAQRAVLLSDAALKTLRQRLAHRRLLPDDVRPSVTRLEEALRFLEDTRERDIDGAWSALMLRRMKEKMRSDPAMSGLVDILELNPEWGSRMEDLVGKVKPAPGSATASIAGPPTLYSDNPLHQELASLLLSSIEEASPALSLSEKLKLVLPLMQPLMDIYTVFDQDDLDLEALPLKIKKIEETLATIEHSGNLIIGDKGKSFMRAYLQMELADSVRSSARGKQVEEIARAIDLYTQILQVFNKEQAPLTWATTHYKLASTYYTLSHLLDDQGQSIEHSIVHCKHALEVLNQAEHADLWAEVQEELGIAYSNRVHGDRNENQESAIQHLKLALRVFSFDEAPMEWANALYILAGVYIERNQGERTKNLQQAVDCLDLALEHYTSDLIVLYREMHSRRAFALVQLKRWERAHQSLVAARNAQRDLFAGGRVESSMAKFIIEEAGMELYRRDAEVLLHMGPRNVKKAIVALEDGRAQAQRAALNLDSMNLSRAKGRAAGVRAKAFREALAAWREAQAARMMQTSPGIGLTIEEIILQQQSRQRLEEAYDDFCVARDAIRKYDDPDFLSPEPGFESIANVVKAQNEALIYLVAGDESGMALTVIRDGSGKPQVLYCPLPQFTEAVTNEILWSVESESIRPDFNRPMGGYLLAQMGRGFLALQIWGESVYDALTHLPPTSGLARAIQQLAEEWKRHPADLSLLDEAFVNLSQDDRHKLAGAFNHALLSIELNSSLRMLSTLGLRSVAENLKDQHISKVAIVPYGPLALFPLPSVLIPAESGEEQPLSRLFEVTIAPSARSLEIARQRATEIGKENRWILAAGNPKPRLRGVSNLAFAEAEVENTEKIAQSFAAGTTCLLKGEEVNKKNVKEGLEKAWLAQLALHGQYQQDAPLLSKLLLAGDEKVPEQDRTITLEECLNRQINLVGIRLLILSACETSIIDVSKAPDEVVGMAAGFLQAGAAGVIASLWAVDDRATYLLMSRFMQLYLDPAHKDWSPARCLADAQGWLREEATNQVLSTYDILPDLRGSTLSEIPPVSPAQALKFIRKISAKRAESAPNACPYADPFYWAAFTVVGC